VIVRLDESSPGKGSSFSVRIPLSSKSEISTSQNIPASSTVPGSLPALNILIIDDDPEILDALEDLIINWGCRPIRACSLVETSDIISTTRIDFAIVDDMLGDNETGLDVALHLAQTLDKKRIVMVTGNVVPRRLADIRNQGFLVFTKPSNPKKLYELIVTTHRFYDEAEISLPAG
jgi:DNA-binding response OmpR family regulator